jgi:hypothetical protein
MACQTARMNTLEKESLWCRFLSPAFKPHHDCMHDSEHNNLQRWRKNPCGAGFFLQHSSLIMTA